MKSYMQLLRELYAELLMLYPKTFREEYIGFLKKFQIEYNEKYLFEWIE